MNGGGPPCRAHSGGGQTTAPKMARIKVAAKKFMSVRSKRRLQVHLKRFVRLSCFVAKAFCSTGKNTCDLDHF